MTIHTIIEPLSWYNSVEIEFMGKFRHGGLNWKNEKVKRYTGGHPEDTRYQDSTVDHIGSDSNTVVIGPESLCAL